MDKETVALIIAQNGLKTASTLLLANAGLKQAKAVALPDGDPTKKKLLKDLAKEKKLASVLEAGDAGITTYLGFGAQSEGGD